MNLVANLEHPMVLVETHDGHYSLTCAQPPIPINVVADEIANCDDKLKKICTGTFLPWDPLLQPT